MAAETECLCGVKYPPDKVVDHMKCSALCYCGKALYSRKLHGEHCFRHATVTVTEGCIRQTKDCKITALSSLRSMAAEKGRPFIFGLIARSFQRGFIRFKYGDAIHDRRIGLDDSFEPPCDCYRVELHVTVK